MRQLTCASPGILEWRDVPAPKLDSDYAALVRPIAVARCDIDLFLAQGFIPAKGAFALGHECVAEIVALGDETTGFEVGQRVVVAFQLSCGTCGACRAGHTAICEAYPMLSDYGMQPLSGVEYGGMLSDLVRVPFANAMLAQVPPALEPVALASVSDNVLDGFRAVASHLDRRPRSDVLIVSHGLPSLPLYAAQTAIALGSHVDFASDDDERLAAAASLGARPIRTDFKRRERRYPLVVDAGLTAVGLDFAIRSTEPEGVCQSISFYGGAPPPVPLATMYTLGIQFHIGRTHAAALLPRVVSMIAAGTLHPEKVTTRVVDSGEAAAAWLEPATKLVVRMDA